jgi:hypothetical protein
MASGSRRGTRCDPAGDAAAVNAILAAMARRTKEVPRKASAKGGRATPKGGRVTPKGGNKPLVKSTVQGAPAPTPKSGRVTPKGGNKPPARSAPVPSGRYTPPIPREYKSSPVWIPVLLIGFLVLGMLTILGNYLGLLPGGAKNLYLLVGLFFITCGFITATRYR